MMYKMTYTYDERLQKWTQTIPPMPTARRSPSVLSLQSALVVVGGALDTTSHYSDAVELFQSDTLQWYKTGHLPVGCCLISLVAIGSTCYALGGWNNSHLNRALYASVDDLLGNAVPANQTTSRRGNSDTQSVWKTLPNTPTYRPTAAVLAGNLLAIGGKKHRLQVELTRTKSTCTVPPPTPGSTSLIYLLHDLTLELLFCHQQRS